MELVQKSPEVLDLVVIQKQDDIIQKVFLSKVLFHIKEAFSYTFFWTNYSTFRTLPKILQQMFAYGRGGRQAKCLLHKQRTLDPSASQIRGNRLWPLHPMGLGLQNSCLGGLKSSEGNNSYCFIYDKFIKRCSRQGSSSKCFLEQIKKNWNFNLSFLEIFIGPFLFYEWQTH